MRRIISWITETSYQRAGIVLALVVLLIGYGIYSALHVKQELIPDISFPVLTVIAQSPGSQPQDLVANVSQPIESAVANIDGLHQRSSTSVEGLSVVLLNFNYGTNLKTAESQVKDALTSAHLAPTVTTSILKFDPSIIPIVDFSVQGDLSPAEVHKLAQDQIVPNLQKINGVGSVDVSGGALTEVVVTLDRQKLLDSGLTYDQVAQALRANNVVLPSGQLATGDSVLPLQTVAVYKSLDDIRAIGIRGNDGRLVRLDSIAQVNEAEAASTGSSRTNGQSAVSIQVVKQKTANTVQVAQDVEKELTKIKATLPQGASIITFSDQADRITKSVNGVVSDGLIGGGLAIIIVFIFLSNWRATLVTAVSIPLSVLVAIILLDRLGYSLNIMTLGGLTIAIGRVIDDSIVVLENIYRHMARGETSIRAIINGSREVTIAIVGATATACAVFLPLGFVGGIIGQLFLSFALAVVFALIASLAVAITVIPVLVRFTIAGRVKVQPEVTPANTTLGRVYTPVLRWALGHRWLTLGIAGVMFVASLGLVPLLPLQFLPDSGEKVITATVDARPGETQPAVLQQAIGVEKLLTSYQVDRYETVISGASSSFGSVGKIISGKGANTATITIELAKKGPSKQSVAKDLRSRIGTDTVNDNISVSASGGGFGSSGISMTLSADTDAAAASLPAAADSITKAVAAVPETANAGNDVSRGQQTLEVRVNAAKATAAGLTAQQVSTSLANLSSNQTITNVTLSDGSRALRLVVSGNNVTDAAALGRLEVARGVPLASIADIVPVTKQTTITRVNGKPAATITADVTSDNQGKVSQKAQLEAQKVALPQGLTLKTGGIAADINSGFASMFIAIGVSVVLVYVIMSLLFGSLLTPLVILFSLPLAMIGALVALVATGSALSISSLIGILMLVGIVVTNAIVMLEFVIMLKNERGYSTNDAIMEGAQTRVRPIMMTAIAAMLALVPLALGRTEGALIASELGRTVIGGLFSSTLLTLVVIPVVYSLVDGLRTRVGSRRSRVSAPEIVLNPASGGS